MFPSVLLLCLLVSAGMALPGGYGGRGGYNVPIPYTFNYGVSGVSNFGHSESGDGANAKGSYYVHLPDGRVQKVTYWADGSGYHASVSYQGKAIFPSYTPSYGY